MFISNNAYPQQHSSITNYWLYLFNLDCYYNINLILRPMITYYVSNKLTLYQEKFWYMVIEIKQKDKRLPGSNQQ